MVRFLAACLFLLLVGCGEKAEGSIRYRAVGREDNKPHTTKLYRQIVEEYPSSPYANQAKTRWPSWRKRVRYSSRTVLRSRVPRDPANANALVGAMGLDSV